MKYETPIYEITKVEVADVITASSLNDVLIVENATGGADYNIDFTKLF